MADPLTFNPYFGWIDVVDDNNVPANARVVASADLLRYEAGIDEAIRRINEHDPLIVGNGNDITTLENTTAGHTTTLTDHGNRVTALETKVSDLTEGAAAVQHAPAAPLTTALPTAVTTINAALTAAFKVPDSGRVLLELSMFVKTTAKGEYRWVIADSASLTTVRSTLAVSNSITEQYVTARALITGLAPNTNMSWVWRHQIVSPGAGTLLIDATHPALMTVRAA